MVSRSAHSYNEKLKIFKILVKNLFFMIHIMIDNFLEKKLKKIFFNNIDNFSEKK